MNKLKLFVENFVVYGLGGVISKVIPLIMIPIVTRLMPDTAYYGVSDLSNTVMQFGCAFAVMGMYDAMYRMFFEKEEVAYQKSVCSTALSFTLCTSAVVLAGMCFFRGAIAKWFLGNSDYIYIVYLTAIGTFVTATNSIVSAPTRMQNNRKVYLLANFISPVLAYSVSLPLLLKGYYLIALPLAAVVSGTVIEVSFLFLNRNWFSFSYVDRKLLKQLLVVALPLFPNFLIYWVFNSCDKIMITNLIGTGQAGIYSVGSKIGQVSQLIYMAFAGGWQFFAFSTMREENQVKNNTLVFEYLGVISFVATVCMCAISSTFFKVVFPAEYYGGYLVAPYLFFAPLLQMLFQVACNQFLVIKKTWPNVAILTMGAFLNVLLNRKLIPVQGMEGAAVATVIGYLVSVIVCVCVLHRMKLMVLTYKFIVCFVVMLGYFIFWRLVFSEKLSQGLGIGIVIVAIYAIIYREDLRRLFSMINKRSERRKQDE